MIQAVVVIEFPQGVGCASATCTFATAGPSSYNLVIHMSSRKYSYENTLWFCNSLALQSPCLFSDEVLTQVLHMVTVALDVFFAFCPSVVLLPLCTPFATPEHLLLNASWWRIVNTPFSAARRKPRDHTTCNPTPRARASLSNACLPPNPAVTPSPCAR